jgi:predicted esterase
VLLPQRQRLGEGLDQMTFQELTDELMRLYPEGKYAEALEVVERNEDRFPEQAARTTFWRMCLLSLCGQTQDVMSVFRQGLDSGLWWTESQFVDPDLDNVRDLPEFKRLMQESNKKYLEMRAQIQPDRTLLIPEDASGEVPLLIALHGRNGHKESNLEYWEIARRCGWLVLSPQSRQALFPGSYCWDDNEEGLADILFHLDEVKNRYRINSNQIIVAGFSQGSGMSIYAALNGQIGARGFIGVGTFILDPDSLTSLAGRRPDVRGYFITGEKDHTLERARAIQNILRASNVPFAEETYPDLGHDFPPNFKSSFEKAIQFILEQQ